MAPPRGARPNRQPRKQREGGGGRGGGRTTPGSGRGRSGGGGRGRDTGRRVLPDEACYRSRIAMGTAVFVIQKQDQPTGHETQGVVARHLTNASYHPQGIKVMLTSGIVGRVTRSVPETSTANDGSTSLQQPQPPSMGYPSPLSSVQPTYAPTPRQHQPPLQRQEISHWPVVGSGRDAQDTFVGDHAHQQIQAATAENHTSIDEAALAQLVRDMAFDEDRAREALGMYDNDVERAVNYLLLQPD
eukprot:scaffold39160_cov275-Amphora_coffeaeformis.AAC.1